jgi:hypothetical protein
MSTPTPCQLSVSGVLRVTIVSSSILLIAARSQYSILCSIRFWILSILLGLVQTLMCFFKLLKFQSVAFRPSFITELNAYVRFSLPCILSGVELCRASRATSYGFTNIPTHLGCAYFRPYQNPVDVTLTILWIKYLCFSRTLWNQVNSFAQ